MTQVADLRGQVVESIGLLLPRVLKREVPDLTPGTRLFSELGLSSAGTLELLLELEDTLELQIDVEDIDQADLETVATLAEYVATHTVADE
ncbi:phosphopantetheine-binding protein [Actinokineospora sp. PR83]|uniref:phosphopantetheine-binding protein n=1 Tax=Actinokineospora sp. PR83 TaxID=2884908 RepID=UPI001F4675DA|nr:phosphopantetheine-binding protein [Actinokineospora sp. PR83]MCG8915970.1 phosphopantetheine-binding protein [Actinokineospora sp. PR83]